MAQGRGAARRRALAWAFGAAIVKAISGNKVTQNQPKSGRECEQNCGYEWHPSFIVNSSLHF